jgi:anti-anti-sigma regulatory factor
MSDNYYVQGKLRINICYNDKNIILEWLGKSIDRNPEDFITPVLTTTKSAGSIEIRYILDFRKLQFMNSSTVAPLVQFLEECKNDGSSVDTTV